MRENLSLLGDLIRSTHTQFTYSFFHILYTHLYFSDFFWQISLYRLLSFISRLIPPRDLMIENSCHVSFLDFYILPSLFFFLEAIILSSFIWQWNGNYALPTAVTYTVAFIDSSFVWQFPFFFHSFIVSLLFFFLFLFYHFYSWLFVLAHLTRKQTNKHGGGVGVSQNDMSFEQ